MAGIRRAMMLILLFMLVVGCSNKDTPLNPENPTTVTMWHYYVGENLVELEKAVATFNQTVGAEQGVVVETVAMGSIRELEKNITDAAQGVPNSKPMPDIFSCYPDKALEIDSYSQLVDLNTYFTPQEKDQYVSDFLQGGYASDGRLLLLPIVRSTELLYVNNTAWQEFCAQQGVTNGSLATWESLYQVARQYYHWTDAATPATPWDGKSMMGFDSVANYIVVGNRQLGVEIIYNDETENGTVILNEEALRRIFTVYYNGYSMGYFNEIGKFRADDVKSNSLIAYTGASSGASYFPTWVVVDREKKDIDFLAIPYPVFEGGEPYAIQQGASMCVTKTNEARQQGAVLFLKWFTGVENNTAFAMTSGYLPVQQRVYGPEQFVSALATLGDGDQAQRNVADVYHVALRQITERYTYAPRPFRGSYDVRVLLQQTLMKAATKGRMTAQTLQQQNLTEAEVLQGIDTEAAFKRWLTNLEQTLDELGIAFEHVI